MQTFDRRLKQQSAAVSRYVRGGLERPSSFVNQASLQLVGGGGESVPDTIQDDAGSYILSDDGVTGIQAG